MLNNYLKLIEEIAEIARLYGRNPSEIKLIPVTKFQPLDKILSLYQLGCREFAESRMQEALTKIEEAPDDIKWHLIGTLQKNKVRKAIENFGLIHSVDTFELAQKISQCSEEMNVMTSILIQVNSSGESTKHGMTEGEWTAKFDALLKLPNLEIQGLMTMAPLTIDETIIRHCFASIREFRDRLQIAAGSQCTLKHLSMGMSHDYRLAIAEGATLLRIGTACFSSKS